MKSLLSLLMLILIMSCTSGDSNLGIEYGKEYFILFEKNSDLFNPDLSNKMIFFEDGTYHREEDVSNRHALYQGSEIIAIKITRMLGNWRVVDGKIKLNDLEIQEYFCHRLTGDVVDCEIGKDQIAFGSAEFFRDFDVCKIDGDKVFYSYDSPY